MIHRFSQVEKIAQDGFHVLYICSAARSGSTLTDMFIGGHSQTASLGEINLLVNAISLNADCSCGDKLSACMQWEISLYKFILLCNASSNIGGIGKPSRKLCGR